MGSPEFALPSLTALARSFHVVGVVTQPDRPAGRGKALAPPPVKSLALELGIPVIQPDRLSQESAMHQLHLWQPHVIVVAAFGQILKPAVLSLPPFGCINVHASLLPRWRGAAPIPAAILHGDYETGITIMQMDEGLDTGPIYRQRAIPIRDEHTSLSLAKELSQLGAALLIETLNDILNARCTPVNQENTRATYAPMLKKEDGELQFDHRSIELWRKIRAYHPWPGAYTYLNGLPFQIIEAKPLQEKPIGFPPGQTLIIDRKPCIVTGDGVLELTVVQPAGKKPLSGKDFLNGFHLWGKIILPA